MTVDPRKTISPGELFILVISTQIGLGIFSFPAQLAKAVGPDAWISTLVGGIFPLIAIGIIGLLTLRFPGISIFEINRIVFGSLGGSLLSILLILYFILTTGAIINDTIHILKLWIYPLTPSVVIGIAIILMSIYPVTKGLKVIIWLNELLIYLILGLFLVSLLLLRKVELLNMLPIGGSGAVGIFKASSSSFLAYLGFEVLLFALPQCSDIKKGIAMSCCASIATTIIYTMVSLVTVGIMGSDMLAQLTYPLLTLLRTFDFVVLDRPDIVLFALWILEMSNTVSAYMYSFIHSLKLVLKIPPKYGTIALCLLVLPFSVYPKGVLQVPAFSQSIGYFGVLISILVPLLTLVTSMIMGKRTVGGESDSKRGAVV